MAGVQGLPVISGDQMWDTELHRGTLSASEPRVFSTCSSDPTAGNDHFKRRKKKSATFPSDAVAAAISQAPPSPTWKITSPSQPAPRPHVTPSWTCSCPAGEPSQALTASRIGSKLFPGAKSPSAPAWICLSILTPHCNPPGASA